MSDTAPTFAPIDGPHALGELHHHLDNTDDGDRLIAWYGQRRAQGWTHANSMKDTIQRFGLESRGWYQLRMSRQT